MVQEPGRLVGRYLRDAAVVPEAVLRQWLPGLLGAISKASAMDPRIPRFGRLRVPFLAWLGDMGRWLGFNAR
jgi:hypothetical protein